MQQLPVPNGTLESEAAGVNADGSLIAGII
jgi:hypothetical protein